MTTPQSDFPTVSERKKSLLCHSSPSKKKESNPLLNNFSIKPIIQFFNKKLKRDPKLKGSLKIERRRKICIEKDFHSDTEVVETGAGVKINKTDVLLTGADLENRVYRHNKNKRASLYSNFGDVDLNFVVDEDFYFADKDEDISFESDTDSNDDGCDNYMEFLQEDVRENEDEIFQELIAEVGSVSVPTRSAPTVEYESLGSMENEDLGVDGEVEQYLGDIYESLEGVKISGEVSETVLIPPELPNFATNIHERAILHEESKNCERTVNTCAVGEAGTEYEERAVITEQNSDAQNAYYLRADNSSIVKECLEVPNPWHDTKEVSTFMNAKDDHGSTEIISYAKSVTDLRSGDHAAPSSLDINSQSQAIKHTENLTNETKSDGYKESNNTLVPGSVLVNNPEGSSKSNDQALTSTVLDKRCLIPEISDSKFTNCIDNATGLAEENENELIVKSSHGSDYSEETHFNPVSETDIQSALLLPRPVSTQEKLISEVSFSIPSLTGVENMTDNNPRDGIDDSSLSIQLRKESNEDFLCDSKLTVEHLKHQETIEIVNSMIEPIYNDDDRELTIEFGMSSDNSESVSKEQEMSLHPRDEELSSKITRNFFSNTDHEIITNCENGHIEYRDRKVASDSISASEDVAEKLLQSCQEKVQYGGLSSSGMPLEITSETKTEHIKYPDNSIYETEGPSKIYVEGLEVKKEGFCENGSNPENSILPDFRNMKQDSEQYLAGDQKYELMSTPVIIEVMESEADSVSPPELDTRLPGPVGYADSDTVSELDTMSEYNSPVGRATPSRIPRIQRSNSLMSFKRRCSLQSLPVSASISSRRSSISSRRSSTMSIDERQPWNYGAGGTPYQKLYPFGKPKRLSVDNYYD